MKNLSDKQKQVLDFIRDAITEAGLPPTIREIAKHFNFSSTGTVRDYLSSLVRKGYIKLQKQKARAIELIENTFKIPIVGRVTAGEPKTAYEDIEGYLEINQLLKPGGEIFALKVKGDSMNDAGIMEGDLAIVKKQNQAEGGDIVIALIADETTIKRFRMVNNKFFLEPANNKYKPIPFTEETSIIGKVVSVIRRYV